MALSMSHSFDAAQEVDHQLALDGVVDHHCRVCNIQQHKPNDCDGHKHPAQDIVPAASPAKQVRGRQQNTLSLVTYIEKENHSILVFVSTRWRVYARPTLATNENRIQHTPSHISSLDTQ